MPNHELVKRLTRINQRSLTYSRAMRRELDGLPYDVPSLTHLRMCMTAALREGGDGSPATIAAVAARAVSSITAQDHDKNGREA
jgi:hypothetical protein